jgi:LIM domain
MFRILWHKLYTYLYFFSSLPPYICEGRSKEYERTNSFCSFHNCTSGGVHVSLTFRWRIARGCRQTIFLKFLKVTNLNFFPFLFSVAEKQRLSLCVGCGGQIHDQYILRVAPDLEWHAACLKCQECRQFLDESCTCFVRDGKTYCKRDYVR